MSERLDLAIDAYRDGTLAGDDARLLVAALRGEEASVVRERTSAAVAAVHSAGSTQIPTAGQPPSMAATAVCSGVQSGTTPEASESRGRFMPALSGQLFLPNWTD